MAEMNEIRAIEEPKSTSDLNAMIKGMSPLVFVGCVALLIIPHFVSVAENDPFYKVWDQLLNPMTMYVIPLFGLLVSGAFGLPTLRQFFASMVTVIFGVTGTMAASYFLGWPYNIVLMFAGIIPLSVWIFKVVSNAGAGIQKDSIKRINN